MKKPAIFHLLRQFKVLGLKFMIFYQGIRRVEIIENLVWLQKVSDGWTSAYEVQKDQKNKQNQKNKLTSRMSCRITCPEPPCNWEPGPQISSIHKPALWLSSCLGIRPAHTKQKCVKVWVGQKEYKYNRPLSHSYNSLYFQALQKNPTESY